MLSLFQDIALSDGILEMFVFIEECLFKNLHRISLLFSLKLAFEDLTKSSMTKDFLDVKRLEADT